MKRLFGAFMLMALIVLAVFVKSGSAQDSGAEERITLSPAISRPSLAAGESGEGKLTIINDGSTSYTFVLYARPFSVDGEEYDPNYTTVNERTEAYQWVQFEKTRFDLKPQDRVEVSYTVNVPAKAASGGHYAVLFAETQPPDDGSSVARKKRVGSLLYLTVKGDVIEKGALQSWDVPMLQTKKPVSSNIRINNEGNVHYQADLTARYSNIFGKKQFELNQEVLILPGTTRRIPVSWENPPYFGIFKAEGTIDYLGKSDVLPGKWVVFMPVSFMQGLVVVGVLAAGSIIFRRRRKGKAGTVTREKKQ